MTIYQDGTLELIYSPGLGFLVADGIDVKAITDDPKEAARAYLKEVEP